MVFFGGGRNPNFWPGAYPGYYQPGWPYPGPSAPLGAYPVAQPVPQPIYQADVIEPVAAAGISTRDLLLVGGGIAAALIISAIL